MIGGIVIGVLVVIALVLSFALFNRRRQVQKPVDATSPEVDKPEKTTTTSTSAEGAPMEEKEALLAVAEKDVEKEPVHDGNHVVDDDEEVELRPKFASPIWIDEIQKNKIFNRQKSLLSEESFKDLSNETHLKPVDEEQPTTESVSANPETDISASEQQHQTDEAVENSNTESDEDRDANKPVEAEQSVEEVPPQQLIETDI